MPWRVFILTISFAIIYGNCLMDNGFHRVTSPYTENMKKSSELQRVVALEGIANKNSGFENFKDIDMNQGQLKIYQPWPSNNVFKRYYNLADCMTNTELEDNNQLEKYSYDEEKGDNLNEHLKGSTSSLELKTNFDSNYPVGLLSRNNKHDTYFSSNNDVPYDLELSRFSIMPEISGYNVADIYHELLEDAKQMDVKRGTAVSNFGCDCKIKNDVLDLGHRYFPRYLLVSICHTDNSQRRCWRGTCKPLQYKVNVLTFRTVNDHGQKDRSTAWLPDDLRQLWKFKTVTVTAGCFCSNG